MASKKNFEPLEAYVFYGLEVDFFSLGDADCIVLTKWVNGYPHRVLIDGGCAGTVDQLIDDLLTRGYTTFFAAFCTHAHNDHARGLAKIISHPKITIQHVLFHNVRNHVDGALLKRAIGRDDNVRQIVELTDGLTDVCLRRGITPVEPDTGWTIKYPAIEVLGPSKAFYKGLIQDVIGEPGPYLALAALGALQNDSRSVPLSRLTSLLTDSRPTPRGLTVPYTPAPEPSWSAAFTGLLSSSSVEAKPTTQTFNETSIVLGVREGNRKLLLTGDAGCRALASVGPPWNGLDLLGVPHHGSSGNLSQGDIERFCPTYAVISAKGDQCHPDRAIVSGLCKVGAQVASTHRGSVMYSIGSVPYRASYGTVDFLQANGPTPANALSDAVARLRL